MSGLMNRRTALAGLAGLGAMTSCAIPGISGLDTSWVTNKQVGLKYVSGSAAQTLDLYLPNGATPPHPVIVAIHGGGFAMGSANSGEVAPMVQGAKRGYAVACVNYRLSGEARFPAAVADCRSAVRYLRANAAKLGVNPDRFAAWGASAGGNLAAMLGTAAAATDLDGDVKENPGVSPAVQAVVDWFGPIDFLKMDAQFAAAGITPAMGKVASDSSFESKYVGQLITKDEALTRRASPATYIPRMVPTTAPRWFIQHGTADTNVPTQQSVEFAAALKAAIGDDKVTVELLTGAGHGGSQFETTANLDKVFAFLDKALK